MCQVIRAQYKAVLREGVQDEVLMELAGACQKRVEEEKKNGRLLTGAMFRYHKALFLYMEYISTDRGLNAEVIPDEWFSALAPILHPRSELEGNKYWIHMLPVFWFDQPEDLEQWRRKEAPKGRCGRIAVLYPEKQLSYVQHHQAIVEEGLLMGDRYQMISFHENILFSYFETPREREQVNIRRLEQESETIKAWMAADPESHFFHFPEANGENFMIIPALFGVG